MVTPLAERDALTTEPRTRSSLFGEGKTGRKREEEKKTVQAVRVAAAEVTFQSGKRVMKGVKR